MIEHRSLVDGSSRSADDINRFTVLLGWDSSRRTLVKRTNSQTAISQTDFSERKTFSNNLARSVTDSNNLLLVIFSVNVLFR